MNFTADQAAPAVDWKAVTPSDSTILAAGVRSLYVAAAGDVVIESYEGNIVTLPAVAAGTILPVMPRRVRAATAATVIALY